MSCFSIKEALQYAFTAYARHLGMCLFAGVLVGGSWYGAERVPYLLAKKLGIEHRKLLITLPDSGQSDIQVLSGIPEQNRVLEGLRKAGITNLTMCLSTPHYFFLVLAVFLAFLLVHLFFFMAMVKLSLAIRDTGKSSVAAMLQVRSIFLRLLGGFALLMSYVLAMVLGVSIAMIPLGYIVRALMGSDSQTPIVTFFGYTVRVLSGTAATFIILLVWTVLMVCIAVWMLRYVFFSYFIIDNRTRSARTSLKMSKELVHGSRFKMLVALGSIVALSMCITSLVKSILAFFGWALAHNLPVTEIVSAAFSAPLILLLLSYIYRKLLVVKHSS